MSVTSSHIALIARAELGLSAPYEAPEGELEILVAGIFAEVFGVDRVGVDDDFFEIGGDSLVAEALSLAISGQTGRDFHISALVKHGSPRKIAALLKGKSSKTDATVATARPPIFMIHGRDGLTFPSAEFRRALADDQTLHMFELPGIRGGHYFDRIEDIAAAYVAELEHHYKEGPIFLASFCMGALIALEMAAQLAKRGRPVRQLVLLDPGIPKSLLTDEPGAQSPPNQSPPRQVWRDWLKTLLQRLPSANHKEPLQKETIADKYRRRLEQKAREGHVKHPGLQLSIDAQAKLRAAYRRYRPVPFDGPVAILSSSGRESTLRDFWNRHAPQRHVHVVMKHHNETGSAATGFCMQSIFDAALAQTQPQGCAE
jgi:thioesterase domain-containing protein